MVESTKKHAKVSFSEEDAGTLIQRYEAATILTLLQEVARYPNVKIDWNELVKNTSTGISNAREYQMLWRHLAYRDALPENLDDGAEPLDDDSDLECEVEALPHMTNETALEAAACVKVMIASGILRESSPSSSTIEAPMTINVPVCRSSRTPEENSQPSNLMLGTNIIFPVTVQRQTLPTVSSTEGVEAKGSAGGKLSSKRKRKAWSEEEDMQLRAAVQRCGEGNWANISKGDDFPIKRSPTQLAQDGNGNCKKEKRRQQRRWSILRKKDGTTNSGTNLTSSQIAAEHLATRHSLSLALDMPLKKLTAPGTTDPATRTALNASIKNPVQPGNIVEASTVHGSSIQPQHPSQRALLGSGSPAKSEAPEKTILKSIPSPDSAVRATAVAVGARIVSPSDILSLQKTTQERSAVNHMPIGNSSMKPSTPGSSITYPKAHSNALRPASCTSSVKAVSPTIDNTPIALSNMSTEQNNPVCSGVNEVTLKQINPTQELKVSDPSVAPKERVQDDEAPAMKNSLSEETLEDNSVSENPAEFNNQEVVKNSNSALNTETAENRHIAVDINDDKGRQVSNHKKTMNLPVLDGGEYYSAINENSNGQSMNEKQEILPSMVQDECNKNMVLPS